MTLNEIPTGDIFSVVPPLIYSRITDVVKLDVDRSGVVALTYEDGSVERASVPLPAALEDIDFFSTVGAVQATPAIRKATGEGE